ncbi:hypothetical protein R1sor_009327 [Riccia sorocarpa]|uniref:Uncharacterized protein n=1 Tax=Riccia sorocarpa TaxID=122646 RepID=A0ABD3HWD5_9MARC
MAETMGYVVYMMEVDERPPSYIVRGNIREVLGTCMEMAHCVIWTSKSRAFTMSVIMDLDRRGLLLTGVASELLCTIWCYDECFRTRPSADDSSVKHISMKEFKRFLDRCVCTRDILLVDTVVVANSLNHPSNVVHPPQLVQHLPRVGQDEFVMDRLLPWVTEVLVDTVVAANSLNHPSNAVYPPQFVQHLPRVGQDEFVMDRLLPWLRRWAHDISPTTSWVELYRREVDGADPLAGLRRYWDQTSDIDCRIIWRNVPRSEAMVLAGFWRAMLVQTRDTDCPVDDCPPAPEAEDPTPKAEDPTLEPEEPTRELDEPTRELAWSRHGTLGVPCSRRLPLFE